MGFTLDFIFCGSLVLILLTLLVVISKQISEQINGRKYSRSEIVSDALTRRIITLFKTDGAGFILYYYFQGTHDGSSEIYENYTSCSLLLLDMSVCCSFNFLRAIFNTKAFPAILKTPLRLTLTTSVQGQQPVLVFALCDVVSLVCSAVLGYHSVYSKSLVATVFVGLAFLHKIIKKIKKQDFYLTDCLTCTLFVYNSLKQVFGINMMMNLTVDLKALMEYKHLGYQYCQETTYCQGKLMIGLGDIVMVGSFLVVFLRVDYFYWIQLILESNNHPNVSNVNIEDEAEDAEETKPNTSVITPEPLHTPQEKPAISRRGKKIRWIKNRKWIN